MVELSMRDPDPSSTAKPIAGRSIRRSKLRQPRGPLAASSIGGSKSDSSGWGGSAVLTVVNGGSKLLIFVRRKRPHSREAASSQPLCLTAGSCEAQPLLGRSGS